MQGRGLLLPVGKSPPLRGDLRNDNGTQDTNLPSSSSHNHIETLDQNLLPLPSSSTDLVKHDDLIAKVTTKAYSELSRLSQIAAIAAESSSQASHQRTRPFTSSSHHNSNNNSNTPSMFIKPSKSKRLGKGSDLQTQLDRNRNLLKSREVCRLLSATQLDKLKQDTVELERALAAKKEKTQAQELEEVMMDLRVGENDQDCHDSSPKRLNLRSMQQKGKSMMISVEENAKLQRANFKAEREMERTREYEMMGRQMGKLDLINDEKQSGRHRRRNTSDKEEGDDEDEIDVLGLGQANETEMDAPEGADDDHW